MADLNSGKGKFWGVDENVKYADSFKGATKVAEKVKKGGTENKPDGYVVDAIDIDWGGLKLTAIDNGWNQETISSTEQNAGKGENTQGIHSTAYLLNKISSSFTKIYNEIGGNDNAGLRQKIKTLEESIKHITDSTPGELAAIKHNIEEINKELADPGAAGTLVTILDTLEGFDKNTKGDVKKYIDDHDKAILGSTTDAATAYTVYGVRKYVDTTAKTNLIGKKGDKWSAQKTLYGVVEYVDTTAKENLIGNTADTTIDTHYGLKHILIGNTADTTINTHWGVKNSLIGTDLDTENSNTIRGAKKYTDATYVRTLAEVSNSQSNLRTSLIGASTDATTADTIWGAKNYAKERVFKFAESLIGTSYDTAINTHWGIINTLRGTYADAPTAPTILGVRRYADEQNTELKGELLGNITNTTDYKTIWGTRYYAQEEASRAEDRAVKTVVGNDGDKWDAQKTLYGVVEYVDTTAKENLIGNTADTTIDTHYGLKHILIGNTADTTINTHWGVKNSLIGTASDTKDSNTIKGAKKYADNVQTNLIGKSTDAATANTIWGAKNYANTTVKNSLLGKDTDEWPLQKTMYGLAKYADTKLKGSLLGKEGDKWDAQKTLYGVVKYSDTKNADLKKILIGASTDASTADTIWGAKNYAVEKDGELEKKLIGNTADTTINSHWGVKNSLIGTASDHDDSNTIWGAKNYAKAQISVKKYNQLTAQVIEEGNEGILVFSTVSSYLG